MEARNFSATQLSEDVIKKFLESLNGKHGYFDMYHNYGPSACLCAPGIIAVVMHDSNWSDCGGGIERNNSIQIFNETFEIMAQSDQVNYRDRSNGKYDNYYNQYREILDIKELKNSFDIKVKTGDGHERVISVPRKRSEPTKEKSTS